MSRFPKLTSVLVLTLFLCAQAAAQTRQWEVHEITLTGPSEGNPFIDVNLQARFTCEGQSFEVRGFYDGDGDYRIRFSPPSPGVWTYETRSNHESLNAQRGEFTCTPAADGVRGPVRVRDKFHFAYADGAGYKPIGTTAYAWVHQTDELEEQTLATLRESPFNKIRMCILPTRYSPQDPPARFPFLRREDGTFDLDRFDVGFFRHIDRRIEQLRDLGIEADLILFHPYDEGQMGFDRMMPEVDHRYLRYVVARFAAYRNVWWSLANEFDLMTEKTDADWDRFFQIVQSEDPYQRLRSIHFSQRMYDNSKPWVTHVSVQNGIAPAEHGRTVIYRQALNKPIVLDEVKYEGNINQRWGQLSAEEMVLRFWMGTIAGAYVGHGEALRVPGKPAWLSKGGTFSGQSVPRIAFLRQIIDSAPDRGIEPIDQFYETRMGGRGGEYYLIYFGRETPAEWRFALPREGLSDGIEFRADVIDTWNMTITPVDRTFITRRQNQYVYLSDPDGTISLPGKPYIAIRLTKIAGPATTQSAE